MVNVNLVCQSVPKEPLQARVAKGAVATAITACGFVTYPDASEPSYGIGCNSDYRLRYKEKDITTFMVVMSLSFRSSFGKLFVSCRAIL